MKKINIMNYLNLNIFLRDLFDSKRAKDKKFSQRYYAKRLGWPNSLLSDIIAGRKSLPLNKALEFSHFFKLSHFETEHLIQMCLADTSNNNIKKYFHNLLIDKVEDQTFIASEENVDLYEDPAFLAVYDYLQMIKKFPPVERIVKDLYFLELTAERITKIINLLEYKKMIKIDNDQNIKILTGQIYRDDVKKETTDNGMSIHLGYGENLKKFCQKPLRPFSLNSGYIVLKKENYDSFLNHILRFRNLIISMDQAKETEFNNHQLYQFDINFFPISK